MDELIKKISLNEEMDTSHSNSYEKHKAEPILMPKINLGEDPNSGIKQAKEYKPKKLDFMKKIVKHKKSFLLSAAIIAIFAIINFLLVFRVYKSGVKVKASADLLIQSVKDQDLERMKKEAGNTEKSLKAMQKSYKLITWMGYIPYFGKYVEDGTHAINASLYGLEAADVVVNIIEPYADIIGLKGGNEAKSGQETAQDRIDFIVKTIPEVSPKTDQLIEKTKLVKKEIEYINPQDYPEFFSGRKIREQIHKVIDAVSVASDLIEKSKPLIAEAPYFLGTEGEREYLVLFQNDKELRPTGGFITAYTIASVKNGKFDSGDSSDIYNLDNNYVPHINAPEEFAKYLKGIYVLSNKYRLRDLNWSPDFSESMKVFIEEVESAGIKNVDGIIAVDTQLLVNLLEVIGPIGVPGYGEFSTKIVPECNCPQVIYELESFADIEGPIVWSENEPGKIVYAPANYDNRKKIIGPLMNSILSNTLGQPKEKIPDLFEAVFKSLLEKHVLFYMVDSTKQNAVETFGIAGKIEKYDGDYLYINDANLGGRKSNLYVREEVNQEIEIAKDGSVNKTLTITYKNPEKQDGWLNSVLPNWVRIYVPKGSELQSFEGVEEKKGAYDDLDKTVFAGFFKLRPQGVAKLIIKYKLPFKVQREYKLYLQKQPGKDKPLYSIKLGKQTQEISLKQDKEFKFRI